jgi:hypothetical protein
LILLRVSLSIFQVVKGVGWLHDLDEGGIQDRDCSWNIAVLNFEFLLVLKSWWCDLGLPK